MKKLIVHVMIAVTILFGCYNLIWYFGAYKPYDELQDNFPEIEESGVKIYADKDDFQYYQDRVDEFEAWVQVGESLMAELEKMV